MGRFAHLDTNWRLAVHRGQDICYWGGCLQKRMRGLKEGKEEIIIKFRLPEVSDGEAFSDCWKHSAPTPRLIA